MSVDYIDISRLPMGRRPYLSVVERDDTSLWDDVLERPFCVSHLDCRELSDLDTQVRSSLREAGVI